MIEQISTSKVMDVQTMGMLAPPQTIIPIILQRIMFLTEFGPFCIDANTDMKGRIFQNVRG